MAKKLLILLISFSSQIFAMSTGSIDPENLGLLSIKDEKSRCKPNQKDPMIILFLVTKASFDIATLVLAIEQSGITGNLKDTLKTYSCSPENSTCEYNIKKLNELMTYGNTGNIGAIIHSGIASVLDVFLLMQYGLGLEKELSRLQEGLIAGSLLASGISLIGGLACSPPLYIAQGYLSDIKEATIDLLNSVKAGNLSFIFTNLAFGIPGGFMICYLLLSQKNLSVNS